MNIFRGIVNHKFHAANYFLLGLSLFVASSLTGCTQGNLSAGGPAEARKHVSVIKNPRGPTGEPETDPATITVPAVKPPTDTPVTEAPNQSPLFTAEEFLHGKLEGADQLKAICARGGQDKIRQVFCSATPPVVNSLQSLQAALGLGFTNPNGANAANGNPGFVLTGHSSSLVTRSTSAINPRALVFTPKPFTAGKDVVAVGFVRGEQLAEVISRDTATNKLAFFLVAFKQACNANPAKCNMGDLLTPAVEKNWTSYSIYEDVDLKNTVADCLQCHQPGGPNTLKTFRMQERVNPWTHFFRNNRPGGQALLADFHSAHGTTEDYGGIPATMIDQSDPRKLEDLAEINGVVAQPNEFLTSKIEGEVTKVAPAQPVDNSKAGDSTTWQTIYANTLNANFSSQNLATFIPAPYHDVKVSDPTKLATLTAAYKAVIDGTLPSSQLPDIRQVFPDTSTPADPRLSEIGFNLKMGLDGPGILKQGCVQCHNAKLDQSITRSLFDVGKVLDGSLSNDELDIAVKRIALDRESLFVMPPKRFRSLKPNEIETLTNYLKGLKK